MITYIISFLTIVLIILSLLFLPEVKIGKKSVSLYWVISLVGAILLIILGTTPIKSVFEALTKQTEINPLKLLIIFFSMTVLSVFLDEMGFFRYMANITLKKSKSSQKKLFLLIYVMVSVLTVFTSNDIIILTFTPFIIFFSKNAKINPLPYLIAEFVSANTLSMALIIGNPTNIYIAQSLGIGFFEYFKIMFLPCILSSVAGYFILRFVFKKELKKEIEPTFEDVKMGDKFLVTLAIIHLALCIIILSVSSFLALEMWYICLGFAISLITISLIYTILLKKSFEIFKKVLIRLPFELVPFVLSMFVIVLALTTMGVPEKMAEFLGENSTVFTYGISSFLCANLINNIPMSLFFVEVLNHLNSNIPGGVFASIIGSNIGAYLTPIGALAGIMWLKILKKQNIKLSFLDFMKYGVMVSIPVIIVALGGLTLSLMIFG